VPVAIWYQIVGSICVPAKLSEMVAGRRGGETVVVVVVVGLVVVTGCNRGFARLRVRVKVTAFDVGFGAAAATCGRTAPCLRAVAC